jgi:flagellar protein FlbT
MPLRITLKPKERVFIGGAVVVNGGVRSEMFVVNDVPVLREKDILTDVSANTPCTRIYLAVQLMYMDERHLAEYHERYWVLVRDVVTAAPSTGDLIGEISQQLLAGRYYHALKIARRLVEHEKALTRLGKGADTTCTRTASRPTN